MPMKKTIVVPCIVNRPVERVRPDKVTPRIEQLQADQQGLNAADDQEQHGHQDIHDADLLVIDGGDPIMKHGRPRRRRLLGCHLVSKFGDGHIQLTFFPLP